MKIKTLGFIGLFIISFHINADQNIEIVGGSGMGLPSIAVVNFESDISSDNNMTDIIASDLTITGEFKVKKYSSLDNVESSVQYILTGAITNGNQLSFRLTNNIGTESGNKNLANQTYSFNPDGNIRKVAHTSSNAIYKQLTNVPGIFTSKIAYILHSGNSYSIVISDYDGYNQKILLTAKSPIISLAWDNAGQQISYATLELGKPVVYVQDLYKTNRYIVSNYSGSNSSPTFTSDASQLAVTLTKDYGSHVYLVNNKPFKSNNPATSLIHFGSIDTEASIGKNGSIVFTSNHDGGPQIFMTDLKGSTPVRMTLNLGNYNTTPHLSHDLSKMIFINRNYGTLKTYVMNLATKAAYPVSMNSSLDIGPSFAPNDKLILFSSNSSMYIVNVNGTTQTKLNKVSGDIIDSSWSNSY
jgi:TolB protein